MWETPEGGVESGGVEHSNGQEPKWRAEYRNNFQKSVHVKEALGAVKAWERHRSEGGGCCGWRFA